jgi:hypothetical protein
MLHLFHYHHGSVQYSTPGLDLKPDHEDTGTHVYTTMWGSSLFSKATLRSVVHPLTEMPPLLIEMPLILTYGAARGQLSFGRP